jgi:hypothetical protein
MGERAAVVGVILPHACSAVQISAEVRSAFENGFSTDLLATGKGGLLFGRLLSERLVSVDYAIPYAVPGEAERGADYLLGRWEGAKEAVWHLRGLIPVGIWLAYGPPSPSNQPIGEYHRRSPHLKLPTEPLVLLVATRMGRSSNKTKLSAYGALPTPGIEDWRLLTVAEDSTG